MRSGEGDANRWKEDADKFGVNTLMKSADEDANRRETMLIGERQCE